MLTAMKNVDTLLRLTTNLINSSAVTVYSSVYRNMNLIHIWKEYTMPFIVMQKPNRSNSTTKATLNIKMYGSTKKNGLDHKI